MNRYVNKLIDMMYRMYSLNILEIKDISGIVGKWGLYRTYENGICVIIFSTVSSYYKIDMHRLYSKLYGLQGSGSIQIIIVSIDDSKEITGVYTDKFESYPHCGLILINSRFNKILGFNNVSSDFVYKMGRCMDMISQNKENNSGILNIKGAEITYVLVALNIIVYIITAVLSRDIFTSNINVLISMGAKVNSLISSGEYYRLFSCMFLHAGVIHLAFNMYALVIIGPLVERVYGKKKYIFIYFFSGIAASVFSYVFSPQISIGASGAIFGLLGASLVFSIKMKERINKGYMYSILSVIVINLVLGFSASDIDNFGHIGGLVGGILSSIAVRIK